MIIVGQSTKADGTQNVAFCSNFFPVLIRGHPNKSSPPTTMVSRSSFLLCPLCVGGVEGGRRLNAQLREVLCRAAKGCRMGHRDHLLALNLRRALVFTSSLGHSAIPSVITTRPLPSHSNRKTNSGC